MTGNEYQKEAMRTMNAQGNHLENAVLGLCGESGECADMIKKAMFQGQTFDEVHFAKELGDILWYIALGAYAMGYDLDTIMQMNVDKLRKRYPDGFEVERSKNREEGDI